MMVFIVNTVVSFFQNFGFAMKMWSSDNINNSVMSLQIVLNNFHSIMKMVWTVILPVLLFFMFCLPHSMKIEINITEAKIQEMIGQRQRKIEEMKLSLEGIKVSTVLFIGSVLSV